jgi:hypothetical protein
MQKAYQGGGTCLKNFSGMEFKPASESRINIDIAFVVFTPCLDHSIKETKGVYQGEILEKTNQPFGFGKWTDDKNN